MRSEQESYLERFNEVLAEKELIAVHKWDGSSWSTKGHLSFGTKVVVGVIFAICFLAVFVYGFYKIVAG